MKELDRQSSKKVEIQVVYQIYIIKNPYRKSVDEIEFMLAEKVCHSIIESCIDIFAKNLAY